MLLVYNQNYFLLSTKLIIRNAKMKNERTSYSLLQKKKKNKKLLDGFHSRELVSSDETALGQEPGTAECLCHQFAVFSL